MGTNFSSYGGQKIKIKGEVLTTVYVHKILANDTYYTLFAVFFR